MRRDLNAILQADEGGMKSCGIEEMSLDRMVRGKSDQVL
jgi:hypothetical protein